MSDVEFGGMGVDDVLVGSWGSFWKKAGKAIKKVFKGAAKSEALKEALNSYSPGAGDAVQKGIQLIESAKAGNGDALSQIKGIADAAKAGDTEKQGAHDMLTTINDARNEAKAEIAAVAVGAGKTTVIQKSGKPVTFKDLATAKAFVAKNPGSRLVGAPGGAAKKKPVARPVSRQNVQQAIRRVPQQNRGALMQGILAQQQQNMQQGYPFGMDQYGMQQPYGAQSPYGMQQPYGFAQQQYGSPFGIQPQGYAPFSGYGYTPDYGDYDGEADQELADAFAEDTSYPDEESIQG